MSKDGVTHTHTHTVGEIEKLVQKMTTSSGSGGRSITTKEKREEMEKVWKEIRLAVVILLLVYTKNKTCVSALKVT